MIVRSHRQAGYAVLALLALLGTRVSAQVSGDLPPPPERGHEPWVFRSVLDHRPRMITFALSKTLWAAYDTQTAALYKVWRDGVELDGAVYTTRHGPQPEAQGSGYIINDVPAPWRVVEAGQEVTPEIQYLGHRFQEGRAYLRYALRYGQGKQIEIEELPEAVVSKDGRPVFLRRYDIVSNSEHAQVVQLVAIQSIKKQSDVLTDGTWSVDNAKIVHGALAVHGRLALRPDSTTLSAKFSVEPTVMPPSAAAKVEPGAALIEKSDCSVCHNPVEKTVGPSFLQIANRYKTTAGNIGALAQKVISGGSGAWGDVPMSPHPALSLEQARAMTAYILGLDKHDMDGVDLSAAVVPPAASPPLPPGQQPGVTLRYYELNAEAKGFPVINPEELPNKIEIVPHVQMSWLASQPGAVDFGEFRKKPAFVLQVSGSIHVPAEGEYGFRVEPGLGSARLLVASRKVLEAHGHLSEEGRLHLSAGWHPIAIDYVSSSNAVKLENTEVFLNLLQLMWHPPGQAEAIAPSTAFATEPAHDTAVAAGTKSYTLMPPNELPGDQAPVEGVHPAFKLVNIRPESFQPKVGGMDFLPDGRLVVSTWSPEGAVYALEGVHGNDSKGVTVKEIASGLAEPLGLKVVGNRIFVLQKQELTELVDRNGDGVTDDYRLVSNRWPVSDNFHEFAFGLLYEDGYFYATFASDVLPGGAPANPQTKDRGRIARIKLDTGAVETVARGVRTPNGIGYGVDGEKFVADNQGNWLPASKIVHLQNGAFYGFRAVDPERDATLKETLPVVWLPENEIDNSPSNTVPFDSGIYKGQMLHGEVTLGGLQRVFVEKINGAYQGCAFRFTQGLEAGVNRSLWGPDGALYVGQIGNPGNWGQEGKLFYGLQKLAPTGQAAFEMLAVRIKSNGLEIELTEPLRPGDGVRPEDYEIRQWRYVPTQQYGGPKVDEETLPVRSVHVSADRRRAFLELPGMKPNHMVYVHIARPFVSLTNRALWTTESWCTVNAIPTNAVGDPGQVIAMNTLTPEERAAGWRLLFDGKTTKGWHNYNKRTLDNRWRVEDGALTLIAKGGADIVTAQQFDNFELSYEWKIAPGGNSGVLFHVKQGKYDYVWRTGPEMQVLDDDAHPDGRLPSHRAGANYDLQAPRYSATKPVGTFNLARLVVDNGHVEHWLNGQKVVEYELWSDQWKAQVAASKFAAMPDYGMARSGHIALQDHGDRVWYRNVKIRRLPTRR